MEQNGAIQLIDKLIEDYENKVIGDTIRLINIKSVKSDATPGAPFGDGARRVLDEVL